MNASLTSSTIVLVALATLVAVGLVARFVLWLRQRRLRWVFRTNRRPREFKRAAEGRGLGIDELCRRTGIEERTLREGTPRYTKRTIAKRRGGTRTLLVPDEPTMAVQRTLLHRLFRKLNAHPAATGFEPGRSIVDHARPHVGRRLVVTMDVIDFFSSTKAERLDGYFRRVGWDADVAALLTAWTTADGGLPVGAPTSPRLSNLVNYYLDVQLSALARTRLARYTRYGDDIALSFDRPTPRRVRGTMQMVRSTLKVYGYASHGRRKTRIQPATRRQVITGLVVNAKVNLPRRVRRKLRAVAHHHRTGKPATLSTTQLQGWRAFEQMIETQR